MASIKPTLAKGTRDFGPEQVNKRKYILSCIEQVFQSYGFMPLETPAMENLTTLEGKYGDEGDQLLFRIINSGDYLKELKAIHESILSDESKDHTFLPSYSGQLSDLDAKSALPYLTEKGLRYDLTVPFARYVVMNRNSITFPFRRYQMQPVWRADRPQKGRYREFWQCDADIIGSQSMVCELDLICIYLEAFQKLGIPVTIRLNHRKILEATAEKLGIQYQLMPFTQTMDKLDKVGESAVREELLSLGANEKELTRFFEVIKQSDVERFHDFFGQSESASEGMESMKFLIESLKEWETTSSQPVHAVSVDLTLARGLSYYTGCIFEVTATSGTLKSSIGGGGRYDNLTGIFGMPGLSGVGISFGLDRIYDVMEELQLFPVQTNRSHTQVIICCMDAESQPMAIRIAAMLRNMHVPTEVYPDVKKIGKQLDYANALRIPYAIIIGESERLSGTLTIKNLEMGTQQAIPLSEVQHFFNT